MKIQNIRHLALLISVIGLCSCNSENNTEEVIKIEDSWSIQSARFVYPDRGSHDVRDTQSISPESRIEVYFNKESGGPIGFRTESTCYSNQSPYPNHLEIDNLEKDTMTAIKLLPVNTFKPKSKNELIQCDFSIIAENDKGSKQQYDLKGLKIDNFVQYYNHNTLGFEDLTQTPYLFLGSDSQRVIDIPEGSYKTHLLCQKGYISVDSNQGMTLGELTQPIVDNFEGLQLCRIVSTSQDQVEKYISPVFWLQKNQERVKHHLTVDLPADISIDIRNKPVLTLTLENPNSFDVYINFFEDQSQFKVQPILYMQGASNMVWYHRLLGSQVNWIFDESKVLLRKDKLVRLKMGAHSRTIIKGFADIGVKCPDKYIPFENANSNQCYQQTTLWGYAYDFDRLPTLLQSRVNHFESNQWDVLYNINTAFTDKAYKGIELMSRWSPTRFPHKCSIAVKPEEYPQPGLASHTPSATHECSQF